MGAWGIGIYQNDIALDLHSHGVNTTLIQRGSTTVVSIDPSARLNEAVWDEGGLLEDCDLVVSSSSAWAHGVLVDPGAVHVCYCHNPFRYAWSEREATLAARSFLTRPALRLLLSQWRQWDSIAVSMRLCAISSARTR